MSLFKKKRWFSAALVCDVGRASNMMRPIQSKLLPILTRLVAVHAIHIPLILYNDATMYHYSQSIGVFTVEIHYRIAAGNRQ